MMVTKSIIVNFTNKVILFAVALFMLFACKKNKCETIKPEIAFTDFKIYADTGNGFNTAKLKIYFTDCDGDIGLDGDDTLSPFNTKGEHYYNLKLEYHELQNGSWVKLENLEPPFYYRIPDLTPEGRTKKLEGEIEVSLEPTYYLPFSPYDTFKYTIQLRDRALNLSNIAETPIMVRP